MPSELKSGYSDIEPRVSFENPKDSFALRDGAYEQPIGALYLGVVGDLRAWDASVSVKALQFATQRLMRSTEELASFVRELMSGKDILADGSEFSEFKDFKIETFDSRSVVVATSSDQNRVRRQVRLKGGGFTTFAPRQIYYLRLDDRTCISFQVETMNEKVLSPKWHAQIKEMMGKIITNLRIESKASSGGK